MGPLTSGKSRLVKYYNLARLDGHWAHWQLFFHEAPKMWPLVELALLFPNQHATSLWMHVMHVQQLIYDIRSAWTTLILLGASHVQHQPNPRCCVQHGSSEWRVICQSWWFWSKVYWCLGLSYSRPLIFEAALWSHRSSNLLGMVGTTVTGDQAGFGDARMNGRWKVNDFDSTRGFDDHIGGCIDKT